MTMSHRRWLSGAALIAGMLTLTACTTPIKFGKEALVQPPSDPKVPLAVALSLSDELCQYTWKWHPFLFDLGEGLCHNAEVVARAVFSEVVVVRGAASPPATPARLTPRILGVRRVQPVWAWENAVMSVDLEWRLDDRDGRPVWSSRVNGTGRDTMGHIYIYERQTRRQTELALQEAFTKTLAEMAASPEIKALATRP
jgi:hypothetical protein